MRMNTNEKRRVDSTSGVSETIGAVMLISIVVVSVGLVALFLFSQPAPQKIPNLNFMTGVNTSQTTLYLYHNGGDTLNVGEFGVLVDGVPASYSVSGGGSQWSLGTNLIVPISQVPQSVQIVYNGTGMSGGTGSTGTVLLREASTAVVSSENVSADQLPYLDCSAVRNWNCADQIPSDIVLAQYMKNASVKKITFMKFNQLRGFPAGVLGGGGYHFNFTVADATNSSIIMGDSGGVNNCYESNNMVSKLSVGDKVNVTFDANPNDFLIYGMGAQIWEMAGGNHANIRVFLTYAVNGSTTDFDQRRLCHSYIERYSSLDSTLTVITDNTQKQLILVVNNTPIAVASTTPISLNNLKPLNNGLFLISYTSGGESPLYVIGWADTIKFNGVTQTGLGL